MTASERLSADTLYSQLLGRLSGSAYVEYGPAGPCPYEDDWRVWLRRLFPDATKADFAPRHEQLWDWAWAIELGRPAPPLVAIWPRGGGKSSSSELAAVAWGALRKRRYILYVSGTQDSADKHVQSIAAKLESEGIERWYPALGRRQLSKYGHARGWTGQRLQADSGYVVESVGLDSNIRGTKVGDQRPDAIILDDVDSLRDSPDVTQKKIDTITQSILPSGSTDCIVLAVQNLIHDDSIFSRLAGVSEHKADMLYDRIVAGPYQAVEDLVVDDSSGVPTIIGGVPTWAGQSLEDCQAAIRNYGLSAFLRESQQDLIPVDGPVYGSITFQHCRPEELPELATIAVWVDPAMTEKKRSDACGIQADALGVDGKLYRLWSWEQRATPDHALKLAIAKAVELEATMVGVETNQGGHLWQTIFDRLIRDLVAGTLEIDGRPIRLRPGTKPRAAIPGIPGVRPTTPYVPGTPGQQPPRFMSANASQSKAERQSRMVVPYEQGRIIHVLNETTTVLEKALKRFPKTPDDLADAAYWSWFSLMGRQGYGYA